MADGACAKGVIGYAWCSLSQLQQDIELYQAYGSGSVYRHRSKILYFPILDRQLNLMMLRNNFVNRHRPSFTIPTS